jgi:hypothetical protein
VSANTARLSGCSETGPQGQRVYRKRVVGTVEEYANAEAVRESVRVLIARPIPAIDRMTPAAMTVGELCQHFELRELVQEDTWRSCSTRWNYHFLLMRWISPRWGNHELNQVRTVEVESWLRSLARARSTCAKIRLRRIIRPVAERIGIRKRIGWHTFRHTYSTLLRSVGTEFKVMQELLRHSSLRSTIDIYTQAVTPAKHAAQAAVLTLIFPAEAHCVASLRSKSRPRRRKIA